MALSIQLYNQNMKILIHMSLKLYVFACRDLDDLLSTSKLMHQISQYIA